MPSQSIEQIRKELAELRADLREAPPDQCGSISKKMESLITELLAITDFRQLRIPKNR